MKRIVSIQDISCVGRCSLTVASPIISAAGVEAAVLPTALLSTHTAFERYTFHDLTPQIQSIADTFKALDIDFDAVYTGYLGSFEQIALVEKFFDDFKRQDTVIFVDPVMADNGVLYKGFTVEFARRMAQLCRKADVIVPNLTEASFMLDIPYNPDYDEEYIKGVLVKLASLGSRYVALSGIGFSCDEIGVYAYDSVSGEFFKYFSKRLPVAYHGTGDIFASSALGACMRGLSVFDSLAVAVDFTYECMRLTMLDADRRFYGVNFESALPYYIDLLSERVKQTTV